MARDIQEFLNRQDQLWAESGGQGHYPISSNQLSEGYAGANGQHTFGMAVDVALPITASANGSNPFWYQELDLDFMDFGFTTTQLSTALGPTCSNVVKNIVINALAAAKYIQVQTIENVQYFSILPDHMGSPINLESVFVGPLADYRAAVSALLARHSFWARATNAYNNALQGGIEGEALDLQGMFRKITGGKDIFDGSVQLTWVKPFDVRTGAPSKRSPNPSDRWPAEESLIYVYRALALANADATVRAAVQNAIRWVRNATESQISAEFWRSPTADEYFECLMPHRSNYDRTRTVTLIKAMLAVDATHNVLFNDPVAVEKVKLDLQNQGAAEKLKYYNGHGHHLHWCTFGPSPDTYIQWMRTGDVAALDLSRLSSQIKWSSRTLEIVSDPSTDYTVVKAGDFRSSGKCLVVPSITGLTSGYAGDVTIQFKIGLNITNSVTVHVLNGCSEISLSGTAGYAKTNASVDVARIQQRLNYLGFGLSQAAPLVVNGLLTTQTTDANSQQTLQALRAFKEAVEGARPSDADVYADNVLVMWMSGPQALKWEALSSDAAGKLAFASSADWRWGANWALAALLKGAGRLQGTVDLLQICWKTYGWQFPDADHEAGMTVDLALQGEFLEARLLDDLLAFYFSGYYVRAGVFTDAVWATLTKPEYAYVGPDGKLLSGYRGILNPEHFGNDPSLAELVNNRLLSNLYSSGAVVNRIELAPSLSPLAEAINALLGRSIAFASHHWNDPATYQLSYMLHQRLPISIAPYAEQPLRSNAGAVLGILAGSGNVSLSNEPAPGTDRSGGKLFETSPGPTFGDFLSFQVPIESYFAATDTAGSLPSYSGLADAMESYLLGLWHYDPALDWLERPIHVELSEDVVSDTVEFHILGNVSKTGEYPFDIGELASALGISQTTAASITLFVRMDLDMVLGLDFKRYDADPVNYVMSSDDLYVCMNKVELTGGIAATDISFGIDLGWFTAGIEGGTALYELGLDIGLVNGVTGGKKLTFTDIEYGAAVFTSALTGRMDVSLPISASGNDVSGSASVEIHDEDLFGGIDPTVTVKGSLTASMLSLGDFLTVYQPTLTFEMSTAGETVLGVKAASAFLKVGDSFNASVLDTDNDGEAIQGTYYLLGRKFELTADKVDVEIQDILSAEALGVAIGYEAQAPPQSGQPIFSVVTFTAILHPLGDYSLQLHGLVVRDNGFDIGSFTGDLADNFTIANCLNISSPSLEISDLHYTLNTPLEGTFTLHATAASLAFGSDFTADITDGADADLWAIQGGFTLGDPTVRLAIDQIDVEVPGVLGAQASGLTFTYSWAGLPGQELLHLSDFMAVIYPLSNTVVTISDLSIRDDGFSLSGSVTIAQFVLKDFLTITSPKLVFSSIAYTVGGSLQGGIGFEAHSAAFAIGTGLSATITDGADADELAIQGSYNLVTHAFSFGADQLDLDIPDVLTGHAETFVINYDPNDTPEQVILTLATFSAVFLPLDNLEVDLTNLVVREDGFTLNAAVQLEHYDLGDFLRFELPTLTLGGFSYSTAGGLNLGSIGFAAAVAVFFPATKYSANLSDGNDEDEWGISGTYDIPTGVFSFAIDQFFLSINDVVTVSASGLAFVYDRADTSLDRVLLTLHEGTVSVPDFALSGTLQGLVIRANGFKFEQFSITKLGETAIGTLLVMEDLTVSLGGFGVTFGQAIWGIVNPCGSGS